MGRASPEEENMPEATWVPGIPEWEPSVPVDLVRVAARLLPCVTA